MPQVALNTRISLETHQLLDDYMAELKTANPKASIASVVDEALQEYIQRRNQEKGLKEAVKGDK